MQFLKKIFSKKIIFKSIEQTDVILLDNQFANLNLGKIKNHIYNPDVYYINTFLLSLKIFILNFFKKNFSLIYFEILIKKLRPKVAVGHEMNSNIFTFKKFLPRAKTICYQFGYIFNEDINSFYKKNFDGKIVDYFLGYDERSILIMNKFLKTRCLINGSTKANETFDIKHKPKFEITYVSRYKPLSNIHDKKIINLNKLIRNYDLKFLKILEKFCFEKKIKLNIAFTSKRSDKKKLNFFKKELNYFNSIISNFNIATNNFKNCINSKLVINSTSNLGYELLFTKKKVLFLDAYRKRNQYGFFKKREGPFWYYGNNEKRIRKYIENFYILNQNQWLKKLYASNKSFMKFHKNINLYKNNLSFKKKISKLIAYEKKHSK